MCPLPSLTLAAALVLVRALVKWISERNRRSMSSEMNATSVSCATNASCGNRGQREGWWPCPTGRA